MSSVLLYYKYVPIPNPQVLADMVRAKATELKLLGRVIVAEEGINGTLEGDAANAEAFAAWVATIPELTDMQVKRSVGTGTAFPKLSVKVRNQIVGTHFPPHIKPHEKTGVHVAPETLNQWLESGEEVTIVDMRNSYEYASGHFRGSVDLGLRDSRDLPRVAGKLAPLKYKKVLTVCTGGVRCEPMSAYLIDQGFTDVYQLDGGIHSYMEKYPGKHFDGTLYTFDRRATMHFGGERTVVGACAHCSAPTEQYVNCQEPQCREHYLACTTCAPADRTTSCVLCIE